MRIKIFGRVLEFRNATKELPNVSDDSAWSTFLQGKGYTISATQAIKVAAVFRCVDVIAKTMASLPLSLYRETENGKEKAKDHMLYRLLHMMANKNTTAYEFWHLYVVNLLLTRAGFAKIIRNRAGSIIALQNIPTSRVNGVNINKVNGEQYIRVFDDDGKFETLRNGDFMYTPSLRFTSDSDPDDPIAIAADVLGLTVDLNRFAGTAFRTGAQPGGYVEHPGGMSDQAYARFKKGFEENYAGVANAGRWMLLEEGAKANQFTRDLEKSQALESRKFAVVEICRMFGVPPHLVYDLERATFSNIEHQSTEFAQNCITPMSVRIEQTIYKDSLGAREQMTMFAKFNVNGLMRGDMAARTAYYNMMRQNGIMCANEIRGLEDMNKIPGGLGEIYAVNGNMISLENVPKNIPKGAKANA